MTYQEYLNSPYWQKRRTEIKNKYHCCQICNSTSYLEVHHRYYSNGSEKHILGNEPDYLLILLCHDCHSLWHKLYGHIKLRMEKVKKFRKNLAKGLSKEESFKQIYKRSAWAT